MQNLNPGIFHVTFRFGDQYHLWAFSFTPGVASVIGTSYDRGDWITYVIQDFEDQFGAVEHVSIPSEGIHGIGLIAYECPPLAAPEAIFWLQERINAETQDYVGKLGGLGQPEHVLTYTSDNIRDLNDFEVATLYAEL